MALDQFVGNPYMVGVELPTPGTTPDLPLDATANRISGRFEACTHLNPGRGITTVAARIGGSFVVPGGCTNITITYKYSYEYFINAWVVPGPGYVSSSVGFDYIALRWRPSTGAVERVGPVERNVLNQIPLFLLGDGRTGVYTVENHRMSAPLQAPTEAGEVWQVFLRAYAETGGWGVFVAGAMAQITGTVYGFRVQGV